MIGANGQSFALATNLLITRSRHCLVYCKLSGLSVAICTNHWQSAVETRGDADMIKQNDGYLCPLWVPWSRLSLGRPASRPRSRLYFPHANPLGVCFRVRAAWAVCPHNCEGVSCFERRSLWPDRGHFIHSFAFPKLVRVDELNEHAPKFAHI